MTLRPLKPGLDSGYAAMVVIVSAKSVPTIVMNALFWNVLQNKSSCNT